MFSLGFKPGSHWQSLIPVERQGPAASSHLRCASSNARSNGRTGSRYRCPLCELPKQPFTYCRLRGAAARLGVAGWEGAVWIQLNISQREGWIFVPPGELATGRIGCCQSALNGCCHSRRCALHAEGSLGLRTAPAHHSPSPAARRGCAGGAPGRLPERASVAARV